MLFIMINESTIFLGSGYNYSEGCSNDSTGASAAVRLSNDLFCSYNRNIRPVMNQSSQTSVNTKIFIFNVRMVNEILNLNLFNLNLPMSYYFLSRLLYTK